MKNLFNLKSYFKFLHRNLAYTLIDIFGLSVSLMFVILIWIYYSQENSVDRQLSNAKRIYSLGVIDNNETYTGGHWGLQPKLKSRYPEIESTCAVSLFSKNIKKDNGEIFQNYIMLVDSTFYSIFDFKLLEGDVNTALDSPEKIVISKECATRYFNDENPIGKSIVFNSKVTLTVSGIMAPMNNTSLRNPLNKPVDIIASFDLMMYFNYSSAKTNTSLSNATGSDIYIMCYKNTNLDSKIDDIKTYFKSFYWLYERYDVTPLLLPFDKQYFSSIPSSNGNHITGDKKMVDVLFIIGLFILMFAIMNYINLTVALGGFRAKEMATRQLLGSSRIYIFIHLLIESTFLCVISCIIGSVFAYFCEPFASSLLSTKLNIIDFTTPKNVLLFIVSILIIGIAAGIIPASIISATKPIEIVNGNFNRKTKMLLSKIFIVIQNAITIILIGVAFGMSLQIKYMIDAPLGYNRNNIICISNKVGEEINAFANEVEKLACVEKVSKACGTPFDGGNNFTYTYEEKNHSTQILIGDENYMDIFGLSLDKDNNVSDPNAIYVNHQSLNDFDLNENSLTIPTASENGIIQTPIKGILKDFHIRSLESEQSPLFIQIKKEISYPWQIIIKVSGDPVKAYNEIKTVYKDVLKATLNEDAPYIEQKIKDTYKSQIRMSKIVGVFALIALIISILGLTAMSTYFIQQRTKEVAIRKVYGSETKEILFRLIKTFLLYVITAFIISIPIIHYILNSWISDFSYRIDIKWWIYALAGGICFIISFFAVVFQSYYAANANPVKSLKQK
ncbi:MAG: ABC transporter permease [Bacteroidales bacterium]|nr:ABC transporter permease [Bacteroidales bacterium]